MVFKEINVLDELVREESKRGEESAVDFANDILNAEKSQEERISNDIRNGQSSDKLHIEESNYQIFTEESIRNICIKYRLRFLDSKLFKGEIPYEAIQKTKELEKDLGTELRNFKIIAPASRFSLKDSTKDPILVAQTKSGNYLFIHKWGNDMEWYQKLINFPFSNIQNLAISSVALAIVLTLLVPASVTPDFYSRTAALMIMHKMMILCALTGLIFSASLALGIIFSKDFSDDVWNDKYFN